MLSNGEVEGTMTRFSLHSIEAVYKGALLESFLANVDRSLGPYVSDTTTEEEADVAALSSRIGKDYDAMQFFVAEKVGAKAIVNFDRHFDGLRIRRAEPGILL